MGNSMRRMTASGRRRLQRERLAFNDSNLSDRAKPGTPVMPPAKQLLEDFDGQSLNVEKWLRKAEEYRQLFAWTDGYTLYQAIVSLRSMAKVWHDGLEGAYTDWNGFKVCLVERFRKVVDEALIHKRLSRMMKLSDESYEMFATRVKSLGTEGGVTEQSIIRYIVSGLCKDRIYEHVKYVSYGSLQDIVRHLNNCQANIEMEEKVERSYNKPAVTKPNNDQIGAKGNEQVSRLPEAGTKIICYNCQQEGHISRKCPMPRKPNETKEAHQIERTITKNQDEVEESPMRKILLIMEKEVIKLDTLMDSGSPVSIIKISKLPKSFEFEMRPGLKGKFSGLNSSELKVLGTFSNNIIMGSRVYQVEFLVVPDTTMSVDAILGRDFCKLNGIKIQFVDASVETNSDDCFDMDL